MLMQGISPENRTVNPTRPLRRLSIAASAAVLAHGASACVGNTRPSPPSAQLASVTAARELIARVVPGRAGDFELAMIPDSAGHDVFEVAGDHGRVVLRGSSGVAIASALNWYLEHVAKADVELPPVPIHLDGPLPALDRAVRRVTPYRVRYLFNYCTFSYSMAWWDWNDWQRMIDWMALKGINAPLAITGEEGTWRAVLRDMGFSRAQIGDFLVGPAYFPWGWMANVDGLGGPLPDSWIDSHTALERQILGRERALGMTPILQGFTGHVPQSITQVIPGVKIHQTGHWSAGFKGTWFLDPFDSLFQRFAADFMKRQQELFGTDHYYAADPFNEIDPPSNDSTFLAAMGRAIYHGMATTDSHAIWVLQGWFLVSSPEFWHDQQASALLGAVPDDRMLVLDLWGERSPVWKTRHAFYGKPWVWNVLYNFGGKVSVGGDLPHIAANLDSVLVSPEKGKFSGIGMMIEGFGANPIVEEYVFDQVWRDSVVQPEAWAQDYITRRYSVLDSSAWHAWQILLRTAFRSPNQTGNFLAERPQFLIKGRRTYRTVPVPAYDPKLLAAALDSLLSAAPRLGGNDNYRYDVVNLARQVLGERGLPLVDTLQAAYQRRDRTTMIATEQRIAALLGDIDTLLATRPEFLLGRWIADARRWGTNDAERNLYEWNARNLITLWGTKCTEGENDDLNLYAFKEWSGMFSEYFLPRWEKFFAALNVSLDSGTTFDRKPFAEASCQWEQGWSKGTERYSTEPHGDAIAVSRELAAKWEGMRGGPP